VPDEYEYSGSRLRRPHNIKIVIFWKMALIISSKSLSFMETCA
jgi:hypothetical protein